MGRTLAWAVATLLGSAVGIVIGIQISNSVLS